MDPLMNMPAWSKVGATFLAILAVNLAGIPLGWAILIFTVVLALWSGLGVGGTLALWANYRYPENYLLPVAVLLLLYFTEVLGKTGRIDRTMASLSQRMVSRRWLLAGMPALVGLLPMPGGALFSAPLVTAADRGACIEDRIKAAVNYWFRHVWEYWWPLYPGVILAIRYSGLPLWLYFPLMIPLTGAAVLGGYVFILRRIAANDAGGGERKGADAASPLSALGPILTLVAISILGSLLLPRWGLSGTAASLAAMLAGLTVAVPYAFRGAAGTLKETLEMFKKEATWSMMVLVVAIQLFAFVLATPLTETGQTLVGLMRDEFIAAGVPLLFLIMIIPFISGMVTGVAFGFVGASFPIIFALLGSTPSLAVVMAATVLAYAFGYIGMMFSPVHVCYVVTCAYFRTPLWRGSVSYTHL
ncbi:MAG: DUF401 family protein, partial [Syntrophales bacterium]|nr:DUF401 family protein [Syntrophales bacterium]